MPNRQSKTPTARHPSLPRKGSSLAEIKKWVAESEAAMTPRQRKKYHDFGEELRETLESLGFDPVTKKRIHAVGHGDGDKPTPSSAMWRRELTFPGAGASPEELKSWTERVMEAMTPDARAKLEVEVEKFRVDLLRILFNPSAKSPMRSEGPAERAVYVDLDASDPLQPCRNC